MCAEYLALREKLFMPISWMLDLFRGADDNGPVGLLYNEIVAQARSPHFYLENNVSDDIDGRFDMIIIHIFLTLDRMRKEDKLENLSQKLVNLVISDMDRSLREMGVGDLGVGRRVQSMGKALYGRLEMYDYAVIDEESSGKLAAAIMRNLYRSEDEPDQNAKNVAAYIIAQRESLMNVDGEMVLQGHIGFTEVKELV